MITLGSLPSVRELNFLFIIYNVHIETFNRKLFNLIIGNDFVISEYGKLFLIKEFQSIATRTYRVLFCKETTKKY